MKTNQYKQFREKYSELDFSKLVLSRESLAIKSNEFYLYGSNPEREVRLQALTDILMEKLDKKDLN